MALTQRSAIGAAPHASTPLLLSPRSSTEVDAVTGAEPRAQKSRSGDLLGGMQVAAPKGYGPTRGGVCSQPVLNGA